MKSLSTQMIEEVRRKVDHFSYYAQGEASVHYMTICKALRVFEEMEGYARNAFIGAPNETEIENVAEDVQEKCDQALRYFGGSVGIIAALRNKDIRKHVHLLEEAYDSLRLYSEALQKAAKAEGLASLGERPYRIGVSTNVNG